MVLLVSGATVVVRETPDVGVLVVPGAGNAPESCVLPGRAWAMDNGAFSGLDVPSFLRMLKRFAPAHQQAPCLFVTVPDVVGDASATNELFGDWEPLIHARGFPVAYVGQDGLNLRDVPWHSCEAVFLGGSTEWKLGRHARDLAAYGQAKGKHVHMGRVNSQARIRYASRIGCDSIDGSSWSRWSKRYIPTFAPTLARFETPLFGVVGGVSQEREA